MRSMSFTGRTIAKSTFARSSSARASSARSVLLALSTILVAFAATTVPASAQPPRTVVIGQPCASVQRGVDASGRTARCVTAAYGRIWTWSDSIASPVADLSVPPSWSGVNTDSTGLNAVPSAEPISPLYADRSAMAARLVELVNSWRAEKGIAPLTVDPRLNQLTKYWAERFSLPEFSGRGTAHCPLALCSARVNELGYTSFGEVVRPWTPMPAGDLAAERYFIDSPPHFAILTDPRYTHIGISFHVNTDGTMVVVGQVSRSR
jgi:hypothetical protein